MNIIYTIQQPLFRPLYNIRYLSTSLITVTVCLNLAIYFSISIPISSGFQYLCPFYISFSYMIRGFPIVHGSINYCCVQWYDLFDVRTSTTISFHQPSHLNSFDIGSLSHLNLSVLHLSCYCSLIMSVNNPCLFGSRSIYL